MKRAPTPVLAGIAAADGRFQLRRWLDMAATEQNFEMLHRQIHHIRGYLDALEDAQAITCTEWALAYRELSAWLQEWVA
jgi:hypothetical protein